MVDSLLIAIPVSTALGFLSGLGTGGGSLLILWLTMVVGMPQAEARAINLLFFIPSALIACWFRWKQGALKIRHVLPAILAGSLSALVFSWISLNIDTDILKRLFGALLIFAGFRELFYKEKK